MAERIKPVTLNVTAQEKLREQIMLVLADYRDCSTEFLQSEGYRLDVAHRIMMNVRAVAKKG